MKHGHVVILLGCCWALACATGCEEDTENGGTTTSTSGTGGTSTSSGTGGSAGGGGSTSTSGTGGGTSSTSGTAGGGGNGGSGGSPIIVDCDGAICAPTEVCCYMAQSLSCVDSDQCYGMPLGCDDPGDCAPPALCCHKQGQFLCDPVCGGGPGQGQIVCDSDQDCITQSPHCCPNILSTSLPDTCTHVPCP